MPAERPVQVTDDLKSLKGNREWLTEDGDVVIDVERDMVFVTESFDDVTSGKLREAVMSPLKAVGAHAPGK